MLESWSRRHCSAPGAATSGAFVALTGPYRRELQVHCYRMLGSLTNAEDVLQDTLLAAWRGLPGFAGRSSLRTWLYRIATNQCRNALRAAGRRNSPPARQARGWTERVARG
jgi:RNA polymerase sigma-70 factor (ECF subfamily)